MCAIKKDATTAIDTSHTTQRSSCSEGRGPQPSEPAHNPPPPNPVQKPISRSRNIPPVASPPLAHRPCRPLPLLMTFPPHLSLHNALDAPRKRVPFRRSSAPTPKQGVSEGRLPLESPTHSSRPVLRAGPIKRGSASVWHACGYSPRVLTLRCLEEC